MSPYALLSILHRVVSLARFLSRVLRPGYRSHRARVRANLRRPL